MSDSATPDALPCLVRPVEGEQEWDAVRSLRHTAYARRMAYRREFAATLLHHDARDASGCSTVLGAFRHGDGALLGTVRLSLRSEVGALLPESVPADPITRLRCTFVDRFAVRPGGPRVIAPALMKALWL